MSQSPFWPRNGLAPVVPSLFCPEELRPGHSTSGAAGAGLSREEGPPLTCWQHFSSQPRILLAYFAARVWCWLTVKLVIHQDLKQSCFPITWPPACTGFVLFQPRCPPLCWTSWDFTLSSSPVCWGPSQGKQHSLFNHIYCSTYTVFFLKATSVTHDFNKKHTEN